MKATRPASQRTFLLVSLLATILLMASCVQPTEQTALKPTEPMADASDPSQEIPTNTPEPTPTPLPPTETPLPPAETPTEAPTDLPAPELSGLPADPQRIEFQAADAYR